MPDFNENTATAAVLERLSGCKDARLKEIMTSVITHLHALIREVEPTLDEWMTAIRFLTETGQKCDDKRQEFILLSDTLGVSMLVDADQPSQAVRRDQVDGARPVPCRRRAEEEDGRYDLARQQGRPDLRLGPGRPIWTAIRSTVPYSTSGRLRPTVPTTSRTRTSPR